MIEKNCQQARNLARLVESDHRLELLTHPTLNIVCFRYRAAEAEGEELNRLNRDIVADLQERGIAAPSATHINGKLAIRVAITDHRSRREDFDLLVASVVAVAEEAYSVAHHMTRIARFELVLGIRPSSFAPDGMKHSYRIKFLFNFPKGRVRRIW
jgi:glutamate/tyrosine decarboxylase-like PLP-dependent enzyme